MKKISKKRNEILKKLDLVKKHDPKEAIKYIKDNSYVKFNETLDVAINLSINVSKSDQTVRGVINLPHGTGKKIKVAVMVKAEKEKEAKDAGADIYENSVLNENIQKGNLDFDILGLKIKISDSKGIIVKDIKKNSDADREAVKINDIITQIDDKNINNIEDYYDALANIQSGDIVLVGVTTINKSKNFSQTYSRYVAIKVD